jgi:hypothetical protein
VSKKSFVLEALSLYDLEKIYDLGSVLLERKVPLKKASGEQVVFSSESGAKKRASSESSNNNETPNILPFKKSSQEDNQTKKKPEEVDPRLNTELMMWQREASRELGENIKKSEAFSGYKQSNQLYVVKQESSEGKNKLKFASTFGVLVDKKQA